MNFIAFIAFFEAVLRNPSTFNKSKNFCHGSLKSWMNNSGHLLRSELLIILVQ